MQNIRAWLVDGATVAAAVAAVTVAFTVANEPRPPNPFEREPTKVEDWEQLASSGKRKGPIKAVLTIIEFGDYECPACRRFHSVAEQFLTKYPNEVALIYRHWPLPQHSNAYSAARAAECAGHQDRFWQFHEKLYTEKWTPTSFVGFAAEVGVENTDEFRACSTKAGPDASIEADIQAAKAIDAFGTPALVINGTLLGHIPDLADLEDYLEEAMNP